MDILGVDIGGTFTDFVLLRDGRLSIHKLLSTPDNPARALLAGVAALGAPAALVHGTTVATNALLERRGARTALITTEGFRDVLVIGRGDRPALYDLDVTRPQPLVPDEWRIELAERLDHTGAVLRPLEAADIERVVVWLAAQPIEAVAICLLHAYANPIHERMVLEAFGRISGRPTTDQRPTTTDHRQGDKETRRQGDKEAETTQHATRNTQHATRNTQYEADNGPLTTDNGHLYISASHRVLPLPREYERTSTTVVNAYVGPTLADYVGDLSAALAAQGVRSLRIMASDGGSMGPATARELPARATLSGPAGGVVGARMVARRAGIERIISFDMGGTSTDVALCNGGLPRSNESRVGGLPVLLPSLDIHTVGAGGGSLARIDPGGALRVGPASAGADPGPACYGKGTQPTVTDANLLLGRLQSDYFLGGRMTLDIERARAALAPIADALFQGIREVTRSDAKEDQNDAADSSTSASLQAQRTPSSRIDQAALGVLRVANAAMERAIRTISVERGDDPRDFTLVAFGGAGPLHAAHLAAALGMRRVLIPRFPGVLSALGMLAADVTRDASQALLRPLGHLDIAELTGRMEALAAEGLAALADDGEPPERCRVEFALDLRYRGQSYEITTPLTIDDERPTTNDERRTTEDKKTRRRGDKETRRRRQQSTQDATDNGQRTTDNRHLSARDLEAAAERFHVLHERRYGHAMPNHAIEAVALRMQAISERPALVYDAAGSLPERTGPLEPQGTISAALDSDSVARTATALYARDDMRPGDSFGGPAVVVQLDATTVIPEGWQAEVDGDLNIILSSVIRDV